MRASKVDANHAQIRQALRDSGFSCWDTHDQGKGAPDLVIGAWGFVIVPIEIKDGAKSPSRRKLTPAEEIFHKNWRGYPVQIVESVGEAIQCVYQARAAIMEKALSARGVGPEILRS